MNFHVFLLVFLFLFMLSLAQLYHLYWPHHGPPHSRAAAKMRTTAMLSGSRPSAVRPAVPPSRLVATPRYTV